MQDICVHIYMYIYIYIYIFMYVYIYIYVSVCVHVCVCVLGSDTGPPEVARTDWLEGTKVMQQSVIPETPSLPRKFRR